MYKLMKEVKKMIVGIDIDNCLNNLCEAVLSVYNEDSGDSLKQSDITVNVREAHSFRGGMDSTFIL